MTRGQGGGDGAEGAMSRPFALALILTLLLAAGLALATLMPLPPGAGSLPGSDKAHHVIGFALLALPMSVAQPRAMLWLAPLLAAYGGAIELVQPMVGRGRELGDWLADLAGVGLGTLLGLALHRLRRR
jgi:hypothetical protein